MSNSVYRVIQEERSMFWEVIISVVVMKSSHGHVSNSVYRVIQEERSMFWEVITSVVVRKMFAWTFV